MYHTDGLKGASRIIYEDLNRLLAIREPVSVARLAAESGYSRTTVIGALRELRDDDWIEMEHQNGTRADYRIVEEDDVKTGNIFSAVINFASMGGAEWMDRMQIALIAHTIYNDAKRLRKLAGKVGGDFQANVEVWIEKQKVLELSQVWELHEAYLMRDQVRDLIIQAEEELTR